MFAENVSKHSNHDDSGISLPVFPSSTYLKLHNTSVTVSVNMVKKVIKNIDLSKMSSPHCIPVVVPKSSGSKSTGSSSDSKWLSQDIDILGPCPAGPVLPHGE